MVRKVRTRRCAHKGVGGSSVRKSDDINHERVCSVSQSFFFLPNCKLTGRFELPSTDSESVVIAATLREQGMQRLRVAQAKSMLA